MDKAFEWAIGIIGTWKPVPVPYIVATLIVSLVVAALLRKALRSEEPKHPKLDQSPVVPTTPESFLWVTQYLIDIDRRQNDMARDMRDLREMLRMPDGSSRLEHIYRQVGELNRLLRRRNGRSSKLKSPQMPED